MKHSYYLITVLFSFIACNNNKTNQIELELLQGKKASIPYVIENGDTMFDGIGKYFYANGVIEDSIAFKRGKKNGWSIHYDSSGKITSKIMYKNDSADGIGYFFNNQGTLESESFYVNNKLYSVKTYYENGNLDTYNAIDDSIVFFAVKYDSLGKKLREKGTVFGRNLYFLPSLDSIHVNQIVEIKIPIVSEHNYKTKIENIKLNTKNQVIEKNDSLPLYKSYALYKTKFMEIGRQQVGIAGELKDENGKSN